MGLAVGGFGLWRLYGGFGFGFALLTFGFAAVVLYGNLGFFLRLAALG